MPCAGAGACILLQVYDAFAELVSAKVSALRVGDGMASDTTHGPLITPAGVEKVRSVTQPRWRLSRAATASSCSTADVEMPHDLGARDIKR